jgi:hypothetical protein
VKRTKTLDRAKAAERNRCDSRSPASARGKTSNISGSCAPKRTSVEDAAFILTGRGIKNGGQAKAMNRSVNTAREDQPTGGPRRVLATEAPRVRDIAKSINVQAKSINGMDGPRRVQALDAIKAKTDLPVSGKYASLAAAVSGIPKPVGSRTSGSRIPAPPSNKPRIGAQIEAGRGFLGRRLAGK